MNIFRRKFDGVPYVRENIFPYTEREADRQSKDLWRAGFRVQVTEDPGRGSMSGGREMSWDTWHTQILRDCLHSGICVPYDRASARCLHDPHVYRYCGYYDCPRRVA